MSICKLSFQDNLDRTLVQSVFANKQEEAQAKIKRRKAREESNNGVERKKTYTLKTSFQTLHGRPIENFKFREFIDILNMMDEELLGDIANNKKRRKWNDVERLSKEQKGTK